MKKFYIIWLFLSLIISSCFLCLFTKFSKADIQNSDKYIFKQNTIYNEVNQNGINPDYTYNLRNKDYFSQNYPATYSFDNDIGLENEVIPFVSNVPNSASAKVLESYDNHYSVLELNTTVVDENIFCNFNFYDLEGNIEFWINTNNTDTTKGFALYDDTDRIIQIYLHSNGNFQYLDGITLTDTNFPYYANNWTHLRIHWQTDNDFDLFVNGREIITNGNNFASQIHGINRIMFYNYDDSIFYIDAFGIDDAIYEGIPYYDVNDNYYPIIYDLNENEIDKFEFDYSNLNFRNNLTFAKYKESDKEHFSILQTNQIDNKLRWSGMDESSTYTDFIDFNINTTGSIFNITINIDMTHWNTATTSARIYLKLYDLNNIDITLGWLEYNGRVYIFDYLDGTPDVSNIVYSFHDNDNLDLNYYVNYNESAASLNVNNTIYNFNIKRNMNGIDKLKLECEKSSINDNSIIDINNLGIYSNGSSLVSYINSFYNDDLQQSGYSLYQLHDNYYYPITYYHLLDYDIFINECIVYNYDDYQNFKETYNIFERTNYTEKMYYNLMDNWTYIYSFLIFEYYINVSYPTFINNEGIKLEANIYQDNELNIETYYISDYYYINTDTENNYFYAKNDKLYWNFNKTNSGKNYMSIYFEIDSYLIDDDYGIAYNSYITKNYTGILTLDYDIGSNSYFTINKSDSVKYSEYNLTNQNGYYLEQIRIQISNNDIENVNGYTDGYIDSLNFGKTFYFIDIDDIDNTLLDLEFVDAIIYVIIILIMIIIPCYILYERFGRKVIIPMLMLITLVLMISSFLPIWLGLLILFSGLLFIYHQSKEGVSND